LKRFDLPPNVQAVVFSKPVKFYPALVSFVFVVAADKSPQTLLYASPALLPPGSSELSRPFQQFHFLFRLNLIYQL
jgi:hypothetical protein